MLFVKGVLFLSALAVFVPALSLAADGKAFDIAEEESQIRSLARYGDAFFAGGDLSFDEKSLVKELSLTPEVQREGGRVARIIARVRVSASLDATVLDSAEKAAKAFQALTNGGGLGCGPEGTVRSSSTIKSIGDRESPGELKQVELEIVVSVSQLRRFETLSPKLSDREVLAASPRAVRIVTDEARRMLLKTALATGVDLIHR